MAKELLFYEFQMKTNLKIEEIDCGNKMNHHTGSEAPLQYPAIVSAATGAVKSQQHIPSEVNKKAAQFQYSSNCDDPSAVQRVFECTLAAPANISVGELLSLSPDYQKYNVDFCKVNRMAAYSLSPQLPASLPTATTLLTMSAPVYSSPIMELKVKVTGQFDDIGLYDSGAV